MTPTKQLKQEKRPVKELGTPLGVFSTLIEQGKSDSSQLKVTSHGKGKSQSSPKSLFTFRIGHDDTGVIADSGPSFREPIVSTEGTNSKANSPIPVLDEVLVDTMATSTTVSGTVLVPGAIPGLASALVPVGGPGVPIAV